MHQLSSNIDPPRIEKSIDNYKEIRLLQDYKNYNFAGANSIGLFVALLLVDIHWFWMGIGLVVFC